MIRHRDPSPDMDPKRACCTPSISARGINTTLLDGKASIVDSTATGVFYALPSQPS